jgi:hypothetical protein
LDATDRSQHYREDQDGGNPAALSRPPMSLASADAKTNPLARPGSSDSKTDAPENADKPKQCSFCGQLKAPTAFHKKGKRLSSRCRVCISADKAKAYPRLKKVKKRAAACRAKSQVLTINGCEISVKSTNSNPDAFDGFMKSWTKRAVWLRFERQRQ